MITEIVHQWYRTTDGALFDNKPAAERWENECELEKWLISLPSPLGMRELVDALVEKYPQIVEPGPKQPDLVSREEGLAQVNAGRCTWTANDAAHVIYNKFNITRKEV